MNKTNKMCVYIIIITSSFQYSGYFKWVPKKLKSGHHKKWSTTNTIIHAKFDFIRKSVNTHYKQNTWTV